MFQADGKFTANLVIPGRYELVLGIKQLFNQDGRYVMTPFQRVPSANVREGRQAMRQGERQQ